ncbi:MAG: PAS domain S-box protein [Bacteroidetes bacterium]|nr:PAS domain S-box protein [Bacteroidota bacterium]
MNFWNRLLRMGHHDALNRKQQIRLHTLNAFAFASILFVLLFAAAFVSVGSYSALESLPIALVMVVVLWLNATRRLEAAKVFMVFSLVLVILGMALSDRRTGTEYVLISLACSSILIFDEVLKIFLGFVFSLICFGFYLWYDTTYDFVPDPTVPYEYMKSVVMLTSACAVAVQLLVFRSLINKYAEDLQEAHRKELTTNEELKTSNDELHSLSEQLDWIVKQKSNELQSYIDAINVHVYSAVIDTNGIILKVNAPLVRATGYCELELIGKNISILHAQYQQDDFYRNGALFHSENKTWRGEVKKKRKDGSHFWVDKVIIPLKNESGTANYFLVLALPITERKEAEEQKERISKMLEDIAFRASHKVRGPIARIQGLMNLMENGYIEKEEMSAIIRFLRMSIDEMDMTTRELTRFVNTHYEEKIIVSSEVDVKS